MSTHAHTTRQNGASSKGQSAASDLREQLPATGLKEYWYPAIAARKVGKRKPVAMKIVDEELVLFRDQQGEVAALQNACPHRGMPLAMGDCHFAGTVSCPYHGWTYNGEGECVAVLGEGPDSAIAGMRDARARVYPTRTLKGIVFVWMGQGDPAPIEEDVPEEFFDTDSLILSSVTTWQCNWRPAIENIFDAHVFYVHRNSVRYWLLPRDIFLSMSRMGSKRMRPEVTNGRALTYRLEENPVRAQLGFKEEKPLSYQDVYPTLGGARWPKHAWRETWHGLISKFRRQRNLPPLVRNKEWSSLHLPCTFRVDNRNYIYTRCTVPIDREQSRMFYFYTTRPRAAWKRVRDILVFYVWRNWLQNYNFSGQDRRLVENQHYDTPEKLSGTDLFPLETRRLIVNYGRDFLRQRETSTEGATDIASKTTV
ncbi:aromatic ring-hydroxylating oxygenase subunit alpha [Candidatus Entotheonella palauensis]|uniref:aromatic ring-hydroxylating oxygenase subunit alpha n=1 Tax=Candidatus Entotheonella palauensis TaxID=93172 RepID=UPI000B7CA9F1|nr:aromatic ring-hydroxylating dioxygenase subunit alpha [Candidatus Entotheonella palauensis]